MTRLSILSILVSSVFVVLIMDPMLVYASTVPTKTTEQPKPGIIVIITLENGTTKAIHSDSTNIEAVNGGYFISDASVKASQPLKYKTVSNTVVQQLVGVFVDVRIEDPLPLSPPTSSEGCAEGWGYKSDDPTPICEPLDKMEGPPPDMAFCAALGCPYNPPAEPELPADNGDNNNFATTPVTPTEPTAAEEAQAEPATEPDPGDGNQNGEGGNQNEKSDDNGNSGLDDSSGEGSEE
ncbi:MAG: hypothetical protein WCD28_06435 [Nitrososphaeraceae archaeon]